MAVKPMAGTASAVAAITPLTTSCGTSPSRAATRSGDLQKLELALLGLLVSELRVEDVADLVELARPAGAVEIDGPALRDELQSLHGALDLGARALRDLAHVVLDRGAARVALRLREGQRD